MKVYGSHLMWKIICPVIIFWSYWVLTEEPFVQQDCNSCKGLILLRVFISLQLWDEIYMSRKYFHSYIGWSCISSSCSSSYFTECSFIRRGWSCSLIQTADLNKSLKASSVDPYYLYRLWTIGSYVKDCLSICILSVRNNIVIERGLLKLNT